MRQLQRTRPIVTGLLAALLLTPAARAAEFPSAADTVRREAWQLANGLRVVTVHVPAAVGAAITVVYPGGRDQDPPGREGVSMLLAEVQFTAAAGDIPERSRQEMESLRPFGYDVRVSRRYTAFTELAPFARFPGVLHQVAIRMRGVSSTPALLAAAVGSVRRQLHDGLVGDVAQALYYEVRELAGSADSAAMHRLATGGGIDGLPPAEVKQRLAARFAPSGAVLCIAGNLTGVPVRTLVEREFASLPAAAAAPPPAGLPFGPGGGVERRLDIAAPVGVVGVLAPALGDTLHPSFYLSLLIIGAQASQTWGRPQPPLTSRFQYAILDDPDLARFYPALPLGTANPAQMAEIFSQTLQQIGSTLVTPEALEALRQGVGWLLGGPIPNALLPRLRNESGALNTLATSTAVRELWGGEPFWSVYRERFFGVVNPGVDRCGLRVARPENQVLLLYRPAP